MHDYLAGIQSHSGKRDEKQKVLWQGRGRLKHERVKKFGKKGTKDCSQGDLPASKNGPDQEHGEYVEKAEVVHRIQPIRKSDNSDENAGAGQRRARISLQSN
jgi:hypothetical protein